MATTKQKLTVAIDFQAEIGKAQKSIETLGKSLNTAFNGKNANITKDFDKIQQQMQSIASTMSLPMSEGDFAKVGKELKDIQLKLADIVQEKNKFLSATREQQISLLSKDEKANISQVTALSKDYLKYQSDIAKKSKEIAAAEAQVNAKSKEKTATQSNLTKSYNKLVSAIKDAQQAQEALNKAREAGEDVTDLQVDFNNKKDNVQIALNKYNNYSNSNISNVDNLISGKTTPTGNYNKALNDLSAGLNKVKDDLAKAKEKFDEAKESQNAFLRSSEAGNLDQLKDQFSKIGISISNFDDLTKLTEEDWRNLQESLTNDAIQQKTENYQALGNILDIQVNPAIDELNKKQAEEAKILNISQTASDNAARSIENLKSKLSQLTGMAGSVLVLRKALTSAWQTIQQLDKTMTETAVVTDFSVSDMWKQLPEYTTKAKELGVAINDVYQASTLYYQQGLNTAEVNAVTTQTLKMARIAGLDAAEATDRMTAALRGFNMTINETNASRVSDVYSELAAITASDVDEISTAMTKVASLANSANMSFENTSAFLAQIIETTRESAETAGTALKTVIARFSELKNNPNSTTDSEGEVLDYNRIDAALKSVGISMEAFMAGQEGLDQVFLRLAQRWDELDVKTQRYIATEAAGSRQQSRFIAMMSNYARTQELASAATNANGAASEQYSKTLESMQTKLQNLKNAWDQFTMNIMNNDIIKSVVDILTKLLEIINKVSGESGLIRIGIIIAGLTVAGKLWKKILNQITESLITNAAAAKLDTSALMLLQNAFKTNIFSLSGLKDAFNNLGSKLTLFKKGLTGALTTETLSGNVTDLAKKIIGLSETFSALIPIIGVTFIGAVAIAISYLTSYSYAAKKAQKSTEDLKKASNDLEDSKNKLQEIRDQIKVLEEQGPLEITDQKQLDLLRAEEASLRAQVKLKRELAGEKADKAVEDNKKAIKKYYKTNQNSKTKVTYSDGQFDIIEDKTREERLNDFSNIEDTINDLIETRDFYNDEEWANIINDTELQDNLSEYISDALDLGVYDLSDIVTKGQVLGWFDLGEQSAQEFLAGMSNLDDNQIIQKLIESSNGAFLDYLNGLGTEGAKTLVESVKSYFEAEASSLQLTIPTGTFKGAAADIDNITKKVDKLQTAFDTFNKKGYIEVGTINDILEQFDEVDADKLEQIAKQLATATSVDQVQTAIDDLITSYLNTDTVLTDLDETTADYYKTQLTAMGIINAEEIIESKLEKARRARVLQEKKLTGVAEEVKSANEDEQESLAKLYLAEINLEQLKLTTWSTENRNALLSVASSAGVTGEAFIRLYKILKLLQQDTISAEDLVKNGIISEGEMNRMIQSSTGNTDLQNKIQDRLIESVDRILSSVADNADSGIKIKYDGSKDSSGDSTSKWENPLERQYNKIQEINKLLNDRNKLESEHNDLINSENVAFDKLKENQKAQYTNLKQTIASQKELLGLYESDKAEFINKYSAYSNFMKFNDDGTITVDWTKWEAEENSTDEAKHDILEEMKDEYEGIQSNIQDTEDAIRDNTSVLSEREADARNTYWDLISDTIDMLIEKQQESIDIQQDILDSEQNATSALLNSIESNFTKLRRDRQNDETENDINDLTRRIAYLKQDTSGSNALEIRKLEAELADKNANYQDTLIDDALTNIQEAEDAAYEQRQRLIDNQQSQLDWMEANNRFESEAKTILQNTYEQVNSGVPIEKTEWGKLATETNKEITSGALNSNMNAMKIDLSKIVQYAGQLFGIKETQEKNNANADLTSKTDGTKVEYAQAKGITYNTTGENYTLPTGTYDKATYLNKKDDNVQAIQRLLQLTGWYNGEIDGSFGPATEKAINALRGNLNLSKNGKWDEDLRKAWFDFMIGTGNWTAYATGGLNTTTGPAWLDGTAAHPELVLNPTDTENFIQLKDILRNLLGGTTNTNNIGGNYVFDVDINVDELNNDYDVDSLASRIKDNIVSAMQYRNNTLAYNMR